MGCCASHPPPDASLTLSPAPPPPEDPELEKNVTKIQAHFRGHKVRKNNRNEDDIKKENEVFPCVNEDIQSSPKEEKCNEHAPSSEIAKKIEEWPKIKNAQVEQTLKKVGEVDKREKVELPVLGPYELENGAVYWGQWKLGREIFFCFFLGWG